jgi:hypothetical protein
MSKTGYIIAGIVIFVVLVLAVSYFKITTSPTTVAFLNIEGGEVNVDVGKGWESATDQMELDLEDKVKTGDGEATVVLYESVMVSLDPYTEVEIQDLNEEHVKVGQTSGSTWNKFTGIAGIDEFSVETPTTVATVRGTYFKVDMNGVTVSEGEVLVTMDGQQVLVKAGKKVTVEDGQLVESEFSEQEKQEIIAKMQRTVGQLKELREREAYKHPTLLNQLKKKYGITEAEAREYLDKADRGEYDLAEIEKKSPVKIESVHKIKLITEEIVQLNREIEALSK